MLCPKLIVAEPGRAGVGDDRRCDQGKDGAGEEPEIGNVKKALALAHQHEAAENGCPAANTDGQIFHRIRAKTGHTHQTPVIGHVREDQHKGQHIADGLLPLPAPEPSGIFADQKNRGEHQQNGCQMRRGEQEKLLGLALADAVTVTSPEAIFLFGGLAKAGKLIFEPTAHYMEENMMFAYKNKVKLLPSGIEGKNAAILGSSALIWQKII